MRKSRAEAAFYKSQTRAIPQEPFQRALCRRPSQHLATETAKAASTRIEAKGTRCRTATPSHPSVTQSRHPPGRASSPATDRFDQTETAATASTHRPDAPDAAREIGPIRRCIRQRTAVGNDLVQAEGPRAGSSGNSTNFQSMVKTGGAWRARLGQGGHMPAEAVVRGDGTRPLRTLRTACGRDAAMPGPLARASGRGEDGMRTERARSQRGDRRSGIRSAAELASTGWAFDAQSGAKTRSMATRQQGSSTTPTTKQRPANELKANRKHVQSQPGLPPQQSPARRDHRARAGQQRH